MTDRLTHSNPKTVKVLTPVAEQTTVRGVLAPRVTDLTGLRVGLLDNGKPNAGLLLDHIQTKLSERSTIDAVARRRKVRLGFVPEYIELLAAECDVVINGVAD